MLNQQTKLNSLVRNLACMLAAVGLAVPGLAAAGGSKGQLVIFGTSLSDPGNAFALRGAIELPINNTPPGYSLSDDGLEIPDRPYAKGGHHFSNGPTWVEQYARQRALASNAKPAFQSASAKAANFAIGGARARPSGEAHLSVQVRAFLERVNYYAPGTAFYIVEMGGNDVRDALAEANPGHLVSALQAIVGNIVELYTYGARNFLVWNAPDLSKTPAVQKLPPEAIVGAFLLSTKFNYLLERSLVALENPDMPFMEVPHLPGIRIVRFDAFGTLNHILANAAGFGLTNVTTACIKPNEPPYACQNPDEYLFWDGIHPTRAAHSIIAHAVGELPIP